MKSIRKMTCRALVVSLLALSFQSSQAGLISADAAQSAGGASAERSLILGTLDRADVVAQLQAAGVDPKDARQRVASMNDQEVHAMAQDIQLAPAGGVSWGGVLAVLVVVGIVWYFLVRK